MTGIFIPSRSLDNLLSNKIFKSQNDEINSLISNCKSKV